MGLAQEKFLVGSFAAQCLHQKVTDNLSNLHKNLRAYWIRPKVCLNQHPVLTMAKHKPQQEAPTQDLSARAPHGITAETPATASLGDGHFRHLKEEALPN